MLATIFECTPSAQLCVRACESFPLLCEVQDDGLVPVTFYNAEKGRCEVLGETVSNSQSVNTVFVVLMAGIGILAASMLIFGVRVPCFHFSYTITYGRCGRSGYLSPISNSPQPLVCALSSFIARRCPDFFPVGLRGAVKK
jgi:hypothetical protein